MNNYINYQEPVLPAIHLSAARMLNNGETVNWNSPLNRINYGFTDWYAKDFQYSPYTEVLKNPNNPLKITDHLSAFNSLNKDPAFMQYFNSQTPDVQQYIRNNAGSLDWRNFNNADLQIKQGMANAQHSQWTPQNTLGAIQTGIGVANSLANMYFGYKQNKLANRQLNETIALQRANFANQARTLNTQYRDQMSGRGTAIMSGSAKRDLGDMYRRRKLSETY